MAIVGLLGGVASGKSTVARHLHNLGWSVIVADDVAHQVLNYPQIIRQMQLRWSIPVLKDGEVDRKSIAKIVFTNPEELQWLENLLFPEIEKIIDAMIHLCPNVILDAPTLLKGEMWTQCDQIWYVDCPRDIRLKRYQDRTGSDGADMDLRDAQLNLIKAQEVADIYIDSSVSAEEVMQAVTEKSKDIFDDKSFKTNPNCLH